MTTPDPATHDEATFVAHPDDRLTKILGSPRAAAAFGAIVFVATVVQVLSSPFAYLVDVGGIWPDPDTSLALIVVVVTVGCALQASFLSLSARRPGLALLGTTACYLLLIVLVSSPNWLPAMRLVIAIALFIFATQRSTRLSTVALAVTIVLCLATLSGWALSIGAEPATIASFVMSEGVGFVATAAGATALGVWWRARSRRVAQLREDAERASREHEARVEKARDAERARIAQELHDVAGQHLSGLIALADAALAISAKRPEEALQLVEDVRAEGRFAAASVYSALSDLRAVGGVPRGATRDLRGTDGLAAYWRDRDMAIVLNTEGDLDDLPAVVSTSVFRGIQEALTNVAKHAPGAPVRLTIVRHVKWIEVTIENGPSRSERVETERLGLGWGLDGLRDRVIIMGGQVTAGPTAEGGWSVHMRVPIAEPERPASS